MVFVSCGFRTVSSIPEQAPQELSEWVGEYHGTAKFVAAKKRSDEKEWDPQWIKRKSIDGREESVHINIYQHADRRIHLEVHMEHHIVSVDPRRRVSDDPRRTAPAKKDVYFYLKPSQFSSDTIETFQSSYSESYSISLTRTRTLITGRFWTNLYYGVYQLNLKK